MGCWTCSYNRLRFRFRDRSLLEVSLGHSRLQGKCWRLRLNEDGGLLGWDSNGGFHHPLAHGLGVEHRGLVLHHHWCWSGGASVQGERLWNCARFPLHSAMFEPADFQNQICTFDPQIKKRHIWNLGTVSPTPAALNCCLAASANSNSSRST